jgi:ABC-type multidrug transport system permease subunit
MKVYLTQIKMTLRLTLRNRAALVFGYAFPLIFFFLFGNFMRNGNPGAASQIVAMVLSIGVLGAGFFGASLQAVMSREQNILRRFKVAPISPAPILVSAMVGSLVNYMPMAVLILVLAHRLHGMPWPKELADLLVFTALGVVAFVSLGNVIAAVVNSMQEAQIVTQLFYMPMLLLGGATIPISVLPTWVQTISQFLPSTYFMSGMQNLARGRETLQDNLPAIGALLLAMAVGLLLSFKLFRWEKEEKMRPKAKLWLVAVFAPFIALGVWQTQAKTNIQRAKLLERDLARARTYLIHDARVFTGDGQVIERGSVLVQEGKIAKVFEGDGPDPKSLNAEVIEAAGKTLLPGLIDTRVHLSTSGLLANDTDLDAGIDHELAAYLYSGVTTVTSIGDDPVRIQKHSEAIASGSKLGADLFIGENSEPLTLAASECRDALIHKNAEPLNRSLVRQVTPIKVLDQARAALLSSNAQSSEAPSLGAAKKNLQAAYRANATLSMGSGSGGPLLVHGPGIHRELQLWVDAGVPAAVALQAATYNAARLLKADDRIGRVREGLDANLLLIDGNPLEQISATEHIWTVLFRGERINRSELFDQK